MSRATEYTDISAKLSWQTMCNDVLNLICQYIEVSEFLTDYLLKLDKTTLRLGLYPHYNIRIANKPFDRKYWYYEIREESTHKWRPLDRRGWYVSYLLTDDSFLLHWVTRRYQVRRTE